MPSYFEIVKKIMELRGQPVPTMLAPQSGTTPSVTPPSPVVNQMTADVQRPSMITTGTKARLPVLTRELLSRPPLESLIVPEILGERATGSDLQRQREARLRLRHVKLFEELPVKETKPLSARDKLQLLLSNPESSAAVVDALTAHRFGDLVSLGLTPQEAQTISTTKNLRLTTPIFPPTTTTPAAPVENSGVGPTEPVSPFNITETFGPSRIAELTQRVLESGLSLLVQHPERGLVRPDLGPASREEIAAHDLLQQAREDEVALRSRALDVRADALLKNYENSLDLQRIQLSESLASNRQREELALRREELAEVREARSQGAQLNEKRLGLEIKQLAMTFFLALASQPGLLRFMSDRGMIGMFLPGIDVDEFVKGIIDQPRSLDITRTRV